jgi:hypothetical protein
MPYDLIDGLAGLGCYALTRLSDPTGVACLEGVIDQLALTAQQTSQGIAWFTNPATVIERAKKNFPPGAFHLGMAHGLAGVVALLAASVPAGIRADTTQRLLEGSVSFLLAHRAFDGKGTFPRGIVNGQRLSIPTYTWCWGDSGIALALLEASLAMSNSAWREAATTVMRDLAAWAPWLTGRQDCSLCHGWAGIAHSYNRFFQATGEKEFAETARTLYGEVVRQQQTGIGIGGYQFLKSRGDDDNILAWKDAPGLLTGSAGVCAALASACTDLAPTWDQPLYVAATSGEA